MTKKYFCITVALLLSISLSARRSLAQTAAPSPIPHFDYKADILADLDDMGKKFMNIAQAMPPDKYTWRPSGQASPSVSEVFLLAASQYYHIPSDWGLLKAAGYEADGDQVTGNRAPSMPLEKATSDKGQVMNELFDAVSYFGGIVKTLSDDDLQKPIKVRGQNTTTFGSMVEMDGDIHEYLAEAIAYARMNGVTLPWMAERQEAQVQRGWRTAVTRVKQTN